MSGYISIWLIYVLLLRSIKFIKTHCMYSLLPNLNTELGAKGDG